MKRVLYNVGITYARAILTSIISLYSTRFVLDALGASDYGIYNLIGGMVAMLSFLNVAMTASTQRYLSYSLGKGDFDRLKKIFANSVLIHLFLSLIVVLLIEVIGIYLINKQLNIPPEKINSALSILHFLALTTFFTILTVPYNSVINAHENMVFLAILNVIMVVFNLIIALSLPFFIEDRLFYYGLLIMCSRILVVIIKRIYTKKRYKECNVNVLAYYDKVEIQGLFSFAGWSLFGILCGLGRNQGVSILLNLFYSTVINAAYGIANQLNSQLMFFSQTLMSALKPQIVKSEGANDRSRMIRLALIANKLSFYMFTFFALPLFFEMPKILNLWLKNVPEYSVEFCRSIILLTMVNQINMGLKSAVQAIGRIKIYQITAGSIQLLTLPIGYFILKLGYPPYYIILLSFILEIISTLFRVFYFQYLTGYSSKKYFLNVIINSFLCLAPTVLILYLIKQNEYFNDSFNTIMIVLTSLITYSISIYFIGLNKEDKGMLKKLIDILKKKIKKD